MGPVPVPPVAGAIPTKSASPRSKTAARGADTPATKPARAADRQAAEQKPAAARARAAEADAEPAPPPTRPSMMVIDPPTDTPTRSSSTMPGRPGQGRPGMGAAFAVRGPSRPPGLAEGQTPPPRPSGAKVELKAGDHVVYPTHGVGQVQGIETVQAAGHALDMVVVTFEENRMTLRVPVTKIPSAGLRKLFTPKEFERAIDTLKGRARIKRTMWSRRAQEYEQKINSGDPIQIAEVVRDLQRNAGQPDQSFSERQIYEQALDRLAAEYAAIEKIDRQAASDKLVDFAKSSA